MCTTAQRPCNVLQANPTILFRFEFPDAKQPAGLPVASCLLTRAPIGSIKDDGTQTMWGAAVAAPPLLMLDCCLPLRSEGGDLTPPPPRPPSQFRVIRPYTPISRPSEVGHLDLAIKVYPSGKQPRYHATVMRPPAAGPARPRQRLHTPTPTPAPAPALAPAPTP